MNMNKLKEPRLIILVIVLLLSVATLAAQEVIRSGDQKKMKSSSPIITWTPASVSQTILAGESITIPVSFTSSEDLTNVEVRVVPELMPYVTISPTSFINISKSSTVQLEVILSSDPVQLPDTMEGTLQLRSVGDPRRVYSQPLPITLSVNWNVFREDRFGYSINYPPTFPIAESMDSTQVGLYGTTEAFGQGIPPATIVTIKPLPLGTTLFQWINTFGVSETEVSEVTYSDNTYLRWPSSGGDDPMTVSYSILLAPDKILTITSYSPGFGDTQEFLLILHSLTTP